MLQVCLPCNSMSLRITSIPLVSSLGGCSEVDASISSGILPHHSWGCSWGSHWLSFEAVSFLLTEGSNMMRDWFAMSPSVQSCFTGVDVCSLCSFSANSLVSDLYLGAGACWADCFFTMSCTISKSVGKTAIFACWHSLRNESALSQSESRLQNTLETVFLSFFFCPLTKNSSLTVEAGCLDVVVDGCRTSYRDCNDAAFVVFRSLSWWKKSGWVCNTNFRRYGFSILLAMARETRGKRTQLLALWRP